MPGKVVVSYSWIRAALPTTVSQHFIVLLGAIAAVQRPCNKEQNNEQNNAYCILQS